ncbi:MAG: 3-deoxy-manno-octulosonate cytidylyltransferase [Bacteroidetes bacterium]|nr:3-deoxy-manno-octulosonate cytidylyltransferase [Bacteroidota bacterium]
MNDTEDVVAVIPARHASTRFPGKPLAEIAGRSMIRRVYEQVQKAQRIDRIVVATDDERILRHVEEFGGNAVLTSTKHASGTDRVAEAARLVGGGGIVINVQGDEPMLPPELLDTLVETLQTSHYGCATPVRRITTTEHLLSPNIVKVALTSDLRPLYFSRSPIPHARSLPVEQWLKAYPYYVHIGIYAYRHVALEQFVAAPPSQLEISEGLEQLRLYELDIPILCVETNYTGHAVDTPEDVAVVERLLAASA